jgi:signal transduction histidine kinase
MMKQIILNLLSDAVKFRDDGGTVTLTADIDAQGYFYFTVSDEGIGMNEIGIEMAMTKFS